MAITVKPKEGSPPEKASEVANLIKTFAKEKGSKVVFKASELPPIERIPTGVFEFDLATGGGIPKGRLSIIYGPESSGKTNICYKIVANAQKLPAPNNKVVWVDLEGTFDPKWAGLFGIDLDSLLIVKPGYGEEAVDMIDALARAEDVALLIVDSLAVLTAVKEIEGSVEKMDVGTAPMLVKRLCNKLSYAFAVEQRRDHMPTVVFINQTRFKIGVMFGDPETMPGGQSFRFLSVLTVRLYAKNKSVSEIHPELPVFKETSAVIKKAKVPVCQSNFKYDMCVFPHEGLAVGETDSAKTVMDYLKSTGVIQQVKGGWEYGGVTYPTLSVIRDKYLKDSLFRSSMQMIVIEQISSKQFFIEDKEGK